MQDQLKNLPNQGFAYFYCNRNEEDRRRPLSVLRSYVRQLSTTVDSPKSCVRKGLRERCLDLKIKGSELGLTDCREQLLQSVRLYHSTTIVLDALDECEPDSRSQIIETIDGLVTSGNTVHIFISSRPDRDIRTIFVGTPYIKIQATDNQGDIEKFVREEIRKHGNWGGMSQTLRNDIVEVLFNKSQGM